MANMPSVMEHSKLLENKDKKAQNPDHFLRGVLKLYTGVFVGSILISALCFMLAKNTAKDVDAAFCYLASVVFAMVLLLNIKFLMLLSCLISRYHTTGKMTFSKMTLLVIHRILAVAVSFAFLLSVFWSVFYVLTTPRWHCTDCDNSTTTTPATMSIEEKIFALENSNCSDVVSGSVPKRHEYVYCVGLGRCGAPASIIVLFTIVQLCLHGFVLVWQVMFFYAWDRPWETKLLRAFDEKHRKTSSKQNTASPETNNKQHTAPPENNNKQHRPTAPPNTRPQLPVMMHFPVPMMHSPVPDVCQSADPVNPPTAIIPPPQGNDSEENSTYIYMFGL